MANEIGASEGMDGMCLFRSNKQGTVEIGVERGTRAEEAYNVMKETRDTVMTQFGMGGLTGDEMSADEAKTKLDAAASPLRGYAEDHKKELPICSRKNSVHTGLKF